jgi:hypothetical protein
MRRRRSSRLASRKDEAGFRPPSSSPRHAVSGPRRRRKTLPSPAAGSPKEFGLENPSPLSSWLVVLGYHPQRRQRGRDCRPPPRPPCSACRGLLLAARSPALAFQTLHRQRAGPAHGAADGQSRSQVSGVLCPQTVTSLAGLTPRDQGRMRVSPKGPRHSFRPRRPHGAFERDFSRQKRQAPGYPPAKAFSRSGTVSVRDSLASPLGPFMVELFARAAFCRPHAEGRHSPRSARRRVGSSPRQRELNDPRGTGPLRQDLHPLRYATASRERCVPVAPLRGRPRNVRGASGRTLGFDPSWSEGLLGPTSPRRSGRASLPAPSSKGRRLSLSAVVSRGPPIPSRGAPARVPGRRRLELFAEPRDASSCDNRPTLQGRLLARASVRFYSFSIWKIGTAPSVVMVARRHNQPE